MNNEITITAIEIVNNGSTVKKDIKPIITTIKKLPLLRAQMKKEYLCEKIYFTYKQKSQ